MPSPVRRSSKKKNSGSRKLLIWILGIIGFGILFIAWFLFGPNTGSLSNGEYLLIHTGSDYAAVKSALKEGGFIRDLKSFDLLARQADYPSHIKPGRYHISHGMSNWHIVRILRGGKQSPVKLVINKLRTRQEFIQLLCTNLEADSEVLKTMFSDPNYLAQFGLDTNTAMCAVMPDTYEFYWNTSADKAFRKIEKSFANYWDSDRISEAKKLGLSPQKTIILASIVEEETNKRDDEPRIARVYLNRIAKGMKLQADPTAKFAAGDFALKRITSAQTSIASPYNTYFVTGLPPGPICTPDPRTIDAVLEAPQNNNLYFCAKSDFSGYSVFADTYEAHQKNAQTYQQALNARGIH